MMMIGYNLAATIFGVITIITAVVMICVYIYYFLINVNQNKDGN
jgi:hypothetical protein